jgi:hypothetical protein
MSQALCQEAAGSYRMQMIASGWTSEWSLLEENTHIPFDGRLETSE